jgi:adenine deaminase
MRIEGQIVDIIAREIFSGSVEFENGIITAINRHETRNQQYILPGFVDAHNHIESSMLPPREYARMALRHGTIATVSDPHEIANVCGKEGVRFMLDEADQSPLKMCFAVPSCVPATPLCSSGAVLEASAVNEMLQDPRTYALAEMMNFPGVVNHDSDCMAKIEAAHRLGKPVDGHAPLVTGENLKKYVAAGITTDHEANSLAEGEEKIALGMKILIREGSTARNFNTLHPLISQHKDMLMFCSDDLKAVDLLEGHINKLLRKCIYLGYNLFDVLQIATLNPVRHYHIPMGLLQTGDPADFIICTDLKNFSPTATYVDGHRVDDLPYQPVTQLLNNFKTRPISVSDITDNMEGKDLFDVIQVVDGDLYTPHIKLSRENMDQTQKIVVINRYEAKAHIGIGYIRGFDIQDGALAQSIAHDSHHIIATGSSDELIVKAVNELIRMKGGIVVADPNKISSLALPIAGLMSNNPIDEVATAQQQLTTHLRMLRCPLMSPIVALSFMQLIVIPELKITDRGMFDVEKFEYIS